MTSLLFFIFGILVIALHHTDAPNSWIGSKLNEINTTKEGFQRFDLEFLQAIAWVFMLIFGMFVVMSLVTQPR